MGFDLSAVLERVGGDQELLKEIANLFLEDAPRLLDLVREAIDAGDALGLQRAAHSLKGSVANFGPQEAVDAAYQLEKMGADGKLEGASDAFTILESELQKVFGELSQVA
jgi:HPt (histidine-containing phosphotransfer) domain-containing protein